VVAEREAKHEVLTDLQMIADHSPQPYNVKGIKSDLCGLLDTLGEGKPTIVTC
jgi:hypothetical protein